MKVWLNGRFVFGRDEYHRNMEMDQYRLPVELKSGRNTLLVKCCQNEQTGRLDQGMGVPAADYGFGRDASTLQSLTKLYRNP